MPLPKTLVYNDLSGDEVKHILMERFAALLNDVPYLQRHITLPRVEMSLGISLNCWADQHNPEKHRIEDLVEIKCENFELSTRVDASPKGQPPDKIREDHNLHVPSPVRGPVALEDGVFPPETPDGKRVTMANGVIVDRTGQSEDARGGSTVIKQDFGPARMRGQQTQNDPGFRNNDRREGPVERAVFRKEDT